MYENISPTPQLGWLRIVTKGYNVVENTLKYFLVFILAAMSLMMAYQVATRYFLNSPSNVTEELLRFGLIWLGILGAALCFMKDRHLNLPLIYDRTSPEVGVKFEILNTLLILIFGVFLIFGGYIAIIENAGMVTPMMGISFGSLQSVLFVTGLLVSAVQIGRLYNYATDDKKNLATILVFIAGFVVLYFVTSWFKTTSLYEFFVFQHLEISSLIVLFGSFFLLLGIGTPIAIGLAFSGLLTLSLQIETEFLMPTVGEKLFGGLDSFGFLALPFFILAGNIMNQGGIAKRLINMAMILGKRIPGSLWQTNVVANMLFGSLSGSAIAAATAVGGIIAPIAKEQNYDMPFTTAVNAASAPTGMLIPPTGTFIVYSLITGGSASIIALFLAGYVPGIMMGVAVMIVAYFYAKKHNYPVDKTMDSLPEIARIIWKAGPSLGLIVLVIGGILAGVFTATEAAGIAVVYSLVLSLCYRTLTFPKLIQILTESAVVSGVILFLIACSGLMSWSMTFASIPATIGEILSTISDNKYVILLIINVTLIIVGVFMDMSPAMLIFCPIFYPVVTGLGVDPVHFGVIIIYNLCMGVVTPPVGTVLFVSCSITGERLTTVIKPLLPIFILQFIGLLLITYFPFISLTLPRLFGTM